MQLPAPPPMSPHPDTEQLPPESGQEPPPDPPAGTHGCPPGEPGGRDDAQRLAARLFHLDGFKKSQVAAFLRKNNAFSSMVAQEYLEFFQFEGQTLDRALRTFLQALMLTGETQERERILGHFSRRFHRCNPNAFPSPDAVHSLTCAIMLLNTDLHGPRLGRAMSSAEFVANLSGMMDGQDFPKEMLKALYSSIRSEKLQWAADEEEEEEGPTPPTPRKGSTSLVELPRQDGATTFRQGWLARKVLVEAEGKKAPWGRRGWKSFHTVLRGTLLYFLKAGAAQRGPDPTTEAEEPLGVHHALAERASKYTKRPHVFRLQTADRRVLLFQASSEADMTAWISRLNLAAALLSSPPFPAAVGSQRRFARPILPAAPSRCPPEEQQRAHEEWMERAEQELLELQRNLPEKRSRGRELEEHRLHREHLQYERRRYETYVRLLETWLNAEQDLESWEGGVPPEPPTLTRAHSSPALGPETAPPGPPRVKRNISERRTVRKVVPKRNRNLL